MSTTLIASQARTEPLRDHYGRPLIIPPGEIANPVPYARASSLGRVLTDHTTLTKWKQRQTALGLARRSDLLAMVASLTNDRDGLNKLCEQALEAAESSAGANRGTNLHRLSEAVDRGERPPVGTQESDLERLRLYWHAIRKARLEPIEIETFVVCDDLQAAGTFDRLYRAPSGAVLIGDLKTGALLDDLGRMWSSNTIEIAVQLATYSRGQRYDVATGNRSPLHPDLDPKRGVVIHLPALGGPCRFIEFDLEVGYVLACLAREVLQARKAKGLTEVKLTYTGQEN